MNDHVLDLLGAYINGQIKGHKLSSETEEKAKEVAFLQGGISGLRYLKSFIADIFSLDNDSDKMPDITAISMAQLAMLNSELSVLKEQSDWKTLL
jgi:glycerol kinase